MKTHYSIFRYINNQLSKENIALGLIVITDTTLMYKFSDEKISLVNKLNPNISYLFSYTIKNIKSALESSVEKKEGFFDYKEREIFNIDFLQRLSKYNNGFIQFDDPKPISIDFTKKSFDLFYQKYISLKSDTEERVKTTSKLFDKISKEFYAPLRNTIHVDFQLKKQQIPSLFFEFHLDGLGLNGKVYSTKGIDLNVGKSINEIAKEISEFESVNSRIDTYVMETFNVKPNNNKHYLIIDPYEGEKESIHELYETLISNNGIYYDLVNSSQINDIVDEIKDSKATKFL